MKPFSEIQSTHFVDCTQKQVTTKNKNWRKWIKPNKNQRNYLIILYPSPIWVRRLLNRCHQTLDARYYRKWTHHHLVVPLTMKGGSNFSLLFDPPHLHLAFSSATLTPDLDRQKSIRMDDGMISDGRFNWNHVMLSVKKTRKYRAWIICLTMRLGVKAFM